MEYKKGDRVVLHYVNPQKSSSNGPHGIVKDVCYDAGYRHHVDWDGGSAGVSSYERAEDLRPEPSGCPEHIAHVKKLLETKIAKVQAAGEKFTLMPGIPVDKLGQLDEAAKAYGRALAEVNKLEKVAKDNLDTFNQAMKRHQEEVNNLKKKQAAELDCLRIVKLATDMQLQEARKRIREATDGLTSAASEATK